jgi:hypothetical protein
MDGDIKAALFNLVRVGTVSSVDKGAYTARVIFGDKGGIVSGELGILQAPPFIPGEGAVQRTEEKGGGADLAAYETHSHGLSIRAWLPAVGMSVVCLMIPAGGGDGFILGSINDRLHGG